MTFPSPWDRTLRVSTAVVGATGVAAFGFLVARVLPLANQGGRGSWPVLAAALLIPCLLLGSWALAPRGFSVVGNRLRVERPLRAVEIDLSGLQAVVLLPDDALRGAVRVWGASGFFGYYGRFRSPSLGSFRLYATRRRGLVCLDAAAGRFVVSPEPAESFLEAVRARAPQAAATLPGGAAATSRAGTWLAPAAALALASAVAGVFLVSYGRAPLSVSVGADAVRIERRWAGPIQIPFPSIERVAVLTPEQRRGWVRTAGTAMGPAAYGSFSAPGLGAFRLYAYRNGGYVLLDTDEERVVVSTEDPQRFAEAVRARLPAGRD